MKKLNVLKTRREALENMTPQELVNFTRNYFKVNKVMPGEKKVRNLAEGINAELSESTDLEVLEEYRLDLAEKIGKVVVKEVKLRHVALVNETKKNKDVEGIRPSELPLVLVDTVPTKVLNTVKNVYELDVTISDGMVMAGDTILGELPKNFRSNYPKTHNMQGVVIATDHSNGKFANMSYSLVIDLGQNLAA